MRALRSRSESERVLDVTPTAFDFLDPGVRDYVMTLSDAGIETFESCEGGAGHAFSEPTVRFHGDRGEGFRALAIAQQHGFPVCAVRRAWPIVDHEPTGPCWEMTFLVSGPAR
jgi:hypothetical protein